MKPKVESSNQPSRKPTRRQFLKKGGTVAAATTLAAMAVPPVHAAEDNTIRLALIGCGGRGRGAVGNAMASAFGPVKLYAMADVVESRIASTHKILAERSIHRLIEPHNI